MSNTKADPQAKFKIKPQGISSQKIKADKMNEMEAEEGGFDEDYDDVDLSYSHSKLDTTSPSPAQAKNRSAKLSVQRQPKHTEIEEDSDDSDLSDSVPANPTDKKAAMEAYDYFLKKDKKAKGIEESSELSELSESGEQPPIQQASKKVEIKDVDYDDDGFNDSDKEKKTIAGKKNVKLDEGGMNETVMQVPVSSPPRIDQNQHTLQHTKFPVHNQERTLAGNSTVNKGSVVPEAAAQGSLSQSMGGQKPKDKPQSPGSAERQMKQIDKKLRAIKPQFDSPDRENKKQQNLNKDIQKVRSDSKPKQADQPRFPSKTKQRTQPKEKFSAKPPKQTGEVKSSFSQMGIDFKGGKKASQKGQVEALRDSKTGGARKNSQSRTSMNAQVNNDDELDQSMKSQRSQVDIRITKTTSTQNKEKQQKKLTIDRDEAKEALKQKHAIPSHKVQKKAEPTAKKKYNQVQRPASAAIAKKSKPKAENNDDLFECEEMGAGDQAFQAPKTVPKKETQKSAGRERDASSSKSPQPLAPFGRGSRWGDDRDTFMKKEEARKEAELQRKQELELDRQTKMALLKMEEDPEFTKKKKDAQWHLPGGKMFPDYHEFKEREEKMNQQIEENRLAKATPLYQPKLNDREKLTPAQKREKALNYQPDNDIGANYKPNTKPYDYNQYQSSSVMPNSWERGSVKLTDFETFQKQEQERREDENWHKQNIESQRRLQEEKLKSKADQHRKKSPGYGVSSRYKYDEARKKGECFTHEQAGEEDQEAQEDPQWARGAKMGLTRQQFNEREQQRMNRKYNDYYAEVARQEDLISKYRVNSKSPDELRQSQREYEKKRRDGSLFKEQSSSPSRPRQKLYEPPQKKDVYPSFKMKYQPTTTMGDDDIFTQEAQQPGDQAILPKGAKKKHQQNDLFEVEAQDAGDQNMPGLFETDAPARGDQNLPEQPKTTETVTKKTIDLKRDPLYKEQDSRHKPQPKAKPTAEQEAKKQQQEEQAFEANERFKQLQKEKQQKASKPEQATAAHMQMMKEMEKKLKQQAKLDAVPQLAKQEKKRDVYERKAQFQPVNDKESFSKEYQDLVQEYKQVFFDNKQIKQKTEGFQSEQRRAQIEYDRLMKDKNFIRVNGEIQPKTLPKSRKYNPKIEDIPDYDKTYQEHPLDRIIDLMGKQGDEWLDVFRGWDQDDNGVLDAEEIIDGFGDYGINLRPDESQKIVDMIDKDCNGQATQEEFEKLFTRKLYGEKQFFELMGEYDIKNPLDLEEKILDLRYLTKKLEKEVLLMKRQEMSDNFYKLDKVKNEHKVIEDRIKQLKQKVKDQREEQKSKESNDYQKRLQDVPKTRSELVQEHDHLELALHQAEVKYEDLKQRNKDELQREDLRVRNFNETAEIERCDREQKKIQMKLLKAQLESILKLEKELDERIFKILGRAVTKEDLDELYCQDLEILNKIEMSLDNPITSFAQIIAARKIQKVWRGKLARNRFQEMQRVQKVNQEEKDNLVQSKMKEQELQNMQLRAARLIWQMWLRYKARKAERERIERRNLERRYRDDQMRKEQADLLREQYLIRKIQRFFRARREARKKGETVVNPFLQTMSDKNMSPEKLEEKIHSIIYKNKDTVEMHEDAHCCQCKQKDAEVLCEMCGNNVIYCHECFWKLHTHGHRRRHNSKTIVYTHKAGGTIKSMPSFGASLRSNTSL